MLQSHEKFHRHKLCIPHHENIQSNVVGIFLMTSQNISKIIKNGISHSFNIERVNFQKKKYKTPIHNFTKFKTAFKLIFNKLCQKGEIGITQISYQFTGNRCSKCQECFRNSSEKWKTFVNHNSSTLQLVTAAKPDTFNSLVSGVL